MYAIEIIEWANIISMNQFHNDFNTSCFEEERDLILSEVALIVSHFY